MSLALQLRGQHMSQATVRMPKGWAQPAASAELDNVRLEGKKVKGKGKNKCKKRCNTFQILIMIDSHKVASLEKPFRVPEAVPHLLALAQYAFQSQVALQQTRTRFAPGVNH